MLTKKSLIIFSIIITIPCVLIFSYGNPNNDYHEHFMFLYPLINFIGVCLLLLSFIQQPKIRIKVFAIITVLPFTYIALGGFTAFFLYTTMFSFSCFIIFGSSVIFLSWLKLSKTKIAIIATILSTILPLYLYINWAVFGIGLI